MKKVFDNKIFNLIFLIIVFSCSFSLMFYVYRLNKVLILFFCLILISIFVYALKKEWFDKFLEWLVKYRFLICAVVFIICVIFKINGSSIGMFDNTLPTKIEDKNSILFGQARAIRSDEWDVMTPYYFSQKYNGFNKISNQMSVSGQNMIIGYNSPVWDITIIAKPLVWGFLLFGNEYGLSWYWCLKVILLLLSSFEMCQIITKKNKKLSILGGLLITFGPSTQWWFSPHMPDVILWNMCLFDFVYHFFTHKKEWIRNLLTIIMPIVATQYVIAIFPSFQIGLGYFILALFISLIFRDKIKLFENKKNVIRIIIVFLIFASLTGYFILSNKDALMATLNTVYPGARIDTGGINTVKDTFTDLATPFLAYKNSSAYTNQCEDSTYIHFGIFILLLAPMLIKKLKDKKDKNYIVGIAFVCLISLDMIFMLFGFPEILAKITLFSYINRMKMVLGIVFVFFTIWGFSVIEEIEMKDKFPYIIAIISFALMYIGFIDQNLINYLPKFIYYAEILVYVLILVFVCFGYARYAYAIIIALLIFSSLSINPIVRGTSSITNHPSADKIKEIIEKDDSYWIGYNNIIYSSYLLANGAKTINGVNYYPDFEKWKIIDTENKYEDIYNRYAHIDVLVGKEDLIEYHNTPDAIKLTLSLNTMNKLNIKYIFTNQDLSNNKTDDFSLEEIYKDSDVKIYELINN